MAATRVLLIAIAASMLAWPARVQAQGQFSTSVRIHHEINPDGTGHLLASPAPYGKGPITWASCASGAGCVPIVSSSKDEGILDVGYATPGTVFVATTVQGSQTLSAASLPYLGPVRSTSPPRFSGDLRVGALVQPLAGSWSGGWGKEISLMRTQVCRRADGTGCVVIADAIYWNKCPGAGAVLWPSYRGWYLRIVDRRVPSERPILPFLVRTPVTLKPIKPSPTAAATVVGPIGPATGVPESDCGKPPPFVALSSHPRRLHGRLRLGHVTCLTPCEVLVMVRQGRRRVRLSRKLSGRPARQTFSLSRSAARHLKRGTAVATLRVNGRVRFTDFRINVPRR